MNRIGIGLKRSNNPRGTELVREALAASANVPSLTIARRLWEDKKNIGVWPTKDAVYQAIRRYRGAHGARRDRPSMAAPPSPCSVNHAQPNPFMLPESDEREFLPFSISTNEECSILVLSDVHIPYHNTRALTLALAEGKRRNVKKIILNGDQLDCHWLSVFMKDPRKRHFGSELDLCRQFLEALREEFGWDVEIIWKNGNHDERYEKYLMANANEMFGIREVQLDNLLHLLDYRIEYVTDKRVINVGKLHVIHGHEYGEAILAPVNPARGLFLKANASALCGHLHVASQHNAKTIGEKLIICWSTGCLCELHPEYRPLNKWGHGFAIVNLASNGDYEVENKTILNGRVI